MLYRLHIQRLYSYISVRVKKDIEDLNKERKADGLPELKPTDEQLAEINQDILNYITDAEEFQEEVTQFILKKLESDDNLNKSDTKEGE